MKIHSTLFLLLAVSLVGGFIWFFESRSATTDERKERARSALRIDPDRISYLRVVSGDTDMTCVKKEGEWLMATPVRARVNPGEIDRILWGFKSLEQADVITEKQQRKEALDLSHFGLKESSIQFVLGDAQRRTRFTVGRRTPIGDRVYLRQEGEPDIIVADGSLLELLPSDANTLRDRQLFRGGVADVTKLAIRRAGGFLQLVKNDNGLWEMQQPLPSRTDSLEVQSLLDKLFAAKINTFVADTYADPAAYGLDEAAYKVTLWQNLVEEQSLVLGSRVENTNLIHAQVGGYEAVYGVGTNLLEALNTEALSLRDRRLTGLQADEVMTLTLRQGEALLKMTRSPTNGWNLVTPVHHQADDERVNELVRTWTMARIEHFVDDHGTNEVEQLPSETEYQIVLSTAVETKDDTLATFRKVTMVVQPEVEDDTVLVRVNRDTSHYRVSAKSLEGLTLEPLAYRNRKVLQIAGGDIRSLQITRGDLVQDVVKKGDNQWTTLAEGREVDQDAVTDVLGIVAHLQAHRFVDQDPQDLALYGLDHPTTTLTLGLTSEAGIGKTLTLGSTVSDGVYAMIRGEDVVFIVDNGLAGLLRRDLVRPVPPPVE